MPTENVGFAEGLDEANRIEVGRRKCEGGRKTVRTFLTSAFRLRTSDLESVRLEDSANPTLKARHDN